MTQPDYGIDLFAGPDLDPLGSVDSGAGMMARVAVRRLTTRRGTLFSNPNALSIDLHDFLSADVAGNDPALVQAQVRAALLDDQRISSVAVSVVIDLRARRMTVDIKATGALGPFALTLAITAVTVQILSAT